MKRYSIAAVSLAIVLFTGCASMGGPGRETKKPLYYGYGTGTTITQAINASKLDVLSQVVPDLLGKESAAANRDKLEPLIYTTSTPNAFVYPDTMKTLRQGKDNDVFYYQIGIRINLESLVTTLRANDIYGGRVLPDDNNAVVLADRPAPDTAQGGNTESAGGAGELDRTENETQNTSLTPEERAIIDRFIDSMTFMVYFNEESEEDPFLTSAAVGIANAYLTENRMNAVDQSTIEKVKKEQELAYEEQTGQAVTLIQWIAQKLNADVYVEIDAKTTGETESNKHYGQANITLKFFESSTAVLLASVTYKSPRTFSSSSELDAINNALQSSIYQAMPHAMDKVVNYMRKAVENGIRYELVMQNTADARLMRDFMKKLEQKVRKVELVSQSREEIYYRVFLLGEIEDLQDIVFDISDSIPDLAGIELVYQRGKSITFDTGM